MQSNGGTPVPRELLSRAKSLYRIDGGEQMKAIAVIPGKPNSIHLRDVPKPRVEDVPGGRGVLVKVLRVGVDGTDKEINAAEYGQAPEGYDFLVTGHECMGRVVEVGPNVTGLAGGACVG